MKNIKQLRAIYYTYQAIKKSNTLYLINLCKNNNLQFKIYKYNALTIKSCLQALKDFNMFAYASLSNKIYNNKNLTQLYIKNCKKQQQF